jgi:hypothetical protein
MPAPNSSGDRERERGRERIGDREREGERGDDRERVSDREREGERRGDRERVGNRERAGDREREGERSGDGERVGNRERGNGGDRERGRDRDREREVERERELSPDGRIQRPRNQPAQAHTIQRKQAPNMNSLAGEDIESAILELSDVASYVNVAFDVDLTQANGLHGRTNPEITRKGARVVWVEHAKTGELVPVGKSFIITDTYSLMVTVSMSI